MRILTQGLIANNDQTLKAALTWLEGKLVTHKAHKGKPAGTPMSATTIKNYLAGFYALDLYKADGHIYSATNTEKTRASISVQSKIQVIKPLENLVQNSPSIEVFNENLTQICSQYSQLVRDYTNARFKLHETHQLSDNPEPSVIQKLLIQHCGYSYVGNPGRLSGSVLYGQNPNRRLFKPFRLYFKKLPRYCPEKSWPSASCSNS